MSLQRQVKTDSEISLTPQSYERDELIKIQEQVAARAVVHDDFGTLSAISGIDQSFAGKKVISGIVVLKCPSLEVIEKVHAIEEIKFPYIPTFLSFREGPAIIKAFSTLDQKPDLLMIDGAGINHPRKAGLATHIGVVLDMPAIGITKNILCGTAPVPSAPGEATSLIYEGEQVGWLLKSGKRSRPIVVAPGHRVSLSSALSITKQCLRGYKLPEPVRLAHEYVSEVKRKISTCCQ